MASSQVHASSHWTVAIVAHHCSTMTHPRTDRTTHKQTDRTIVLAHPLTTTTVTRSDHLYLDGTFRSRRRSYHRCLSLSLKFIVIACLFLKSHSRCLNPLSISLSLSLSLDLVFGIWNWDFFFFFGFVYWDCYCNMCLEADKMWEIGRKCVFRAFSRTKTNPWKYFPTDFLECNQIPKNIFLSQKHFQLKLFYTLKSFYIEPNTALV